MKKGWPLGGNFGQEIAAVIKTGNRVNRIERLGAGGGLPQDEDNTESDNHAGKSWGGGGLPSKGNPTDWNRGWAKKGFNLGAQNCSF